MGGKLEVSSCLGKGAIFQFNIQAKLSKKYLSNINNLSKVIGLDNQQIPVKILVVDDQIDNRNLITQLLTLVGFQVLEATNGQEAIAYWQSWQPDLIFMDMRMPIMDGYSATQAIRRLQKQPIPIIALTASAFDEQQHQILAIGCDDFIGKPFREQEIFSKIGQYLGVKYLYAATESQELSESPAFALTKADLQVMPTIWQESLYQAATRVNSVLVEQLLQEIPPEFADLAKQLQDLVAQFRFDLILELTQKEP
jgi:CheY-like chemotaxis protein